MAQRPLTTFRKTCLAAAIAAIGAVPSACSTTAPRGTDDGLGGTLAGADRDAAAATRAEESLWDRAMYLLGFGEDASTPDGGSPENDRLLDEVDLALMEEDAPPPEATDDAAGTAIGVVRSSEWSDIATGEDASAAEGAGDGRSDGNARFVGASDLHHEVGAGETLWDIAKLTTGDATNWHVLADVNDLAPDASVYPGQSLIIPADMVRPEMVGAATDSETGNGTSASVASSGERIESAVTDARVADGGAVVADAGPADEEAEPVPGTELDIGAGETLWDFAKRTTGDATNWRAIADANGFTERQATLVREGQSIRVPSALLRESPADAPPAAAVAEDSVGEESPSVTASADTVDAESATGTASGDSPRPEEPAAALVVVRPDALVPIADAPAPATDTAGPASALAETVGDRRDSDELLAEARSELDDEAVSDPAAAPAYRSDGADDIIGAETAASAIAASLPAEIMVSGTYYPKAVYNDADFSSSLLMRVSPGTTLQVSRAVGPWFEVETEQGTGYMHTRDIK